jgi:hypothetical protein
VTLQIACQVPAPVRHLYFLFPLSATFVSDSKS